MAQDRYSSFTELMDDDERNTLPDERLDDQLWILMIKRVKSPFDVVSLPEPAWVYYASRKMEWEVGNGGFAQAAFNIPEWFPMAEVAYRKLGLEKAAELIRSAGRGVSEARTWRVRLTELTIGPLFQLFRESKLAFLDSKINDVEWWADGVRIPYVRSHRDEFRSIDSIG